MAKESKYPNSSKSDWSGNDLSANNASADGPEDSPAELRARISQLMQNSAQRVWKNLPLQFLTSVLHFSSVRDITVVSAVCKSWKLPWRLSDAVWKPRYDAEWKTPALPGLENPGPRWVNRFRARKLQDIEEKLHREDHVQALVFDHGSGRLYALCSFLH